MSRPSLALAHDYLTQRGGAERADAHRLAGHLRLSLGREAGPRRLSTRSSSSAVAAAVTLLQRAGGAVPLWPTRSCGTPAERMQDAGLPRCAAEDAQVGWQHAAALVALLGALLRENTRMKTACAAC